jgi:RNA polymerase sigma factor (sigma-70 family)
MDKHLITIEYMLADGKRIRLEVTSEVAELVEQSDRQIRSQRRQDRRYLIFTDCIDEIEDNIMTVPAEDAADLLNKLDSHENLYAAMDKLSKTQRRRLEMHYFDGLTYRRIAEIENVSHVAVMKSVAQAIDIIRNHINN